MLFTSISFLYYFLPALIIIYFITPKKYKNIILLIASLLFYFYGEPKYVFLMIAEIIIAYIGAILIDKYKNQSKNILITTLFIHVFLLIIFKYTDFIIQTINDISNANIKHVSHSFQYFSAKKYYKVSYLCILISTVSRRAYC